MPAWNLENVISGGQTGADQAGISAARFLNYRTGGRAPKDYMTEDGPARWLEEFGLVASPVTSLRSRTFHNVVHSNATVIFTQEVLTHTDKATRRKIAERQQSASLAGGFTPKQLFDSYGLQPGSGSRYTAELCVAHRKSLIINPISEEQFRQFIYHENPVTLNVAGTRESRAPGIFQWVYAFLREALVPF